MSINSQLFRKTFTDFQIQSQQPVSSDLGLFGQSIRVQKTSNNNKQSLNKSFTDNKETTITYGRRKQLNKSFIQEESKEFDYINKPIKHNQAIDDMTCSICFNLQIDPVKTKCKHVFCKNCITKHLEKPNACCPLCRSYLNKNVKVDKVIQNKIEKYFPKELYTIKKELEALKSTITTIRFEQGNIHDNKTNKWTIFVKLSKSNDQLPNNILESKQFISWVEYGLEDSLGIEDKLIRAQPFIQSAAGFKGWDIWPIQIQIQWQPWIKRKPEELEHALVFDGKGKMEEFSIDMKAKKFKKHFKKKVK